MSDIKKDLDAYLLLNEEKRSSNYKIDLKLPSTNFGRFNIFKKPQDEQANSWLQDTQDSCCPKLSRIQRILGFILCAGLGIFCFLVSSFYIPVLLFKARKFALLYTLGSVFFLSSLAFLSGFKALFVQMFSRPRIAVSISYFLSLVLTLYFAMFVQSTPFTVVFAIIQIIALLFMVLAALPGGSSGIKFFGQMFKTTVTNTLPI